MEVHHAVRDNVGDALAFVRNTIGVDILRGARSNIARITKAIGVAVVEHLAIVWNAIGVAVVVFEFTTVEDAVGVAVFTGS